MVKFLVPYELRVNAVAPGFVDTEWQKTKPAEIRRNIENKVSLGRFCDPDELAEVYKMLIENSYFNGEVALWMAVTRINKKQMSELDKEYEASLKSIETENKIDRIFYRPIGFRIARMLRGTGLPRI